MGTNAVRPSGEAATSCPVISPSAILATCFPVAVSRTVSARSPWLATSRYAAEDFDDCCAEKVVEMASMRIRSQRFRNGLSVRCGSDGDYREVSDFEFRNTKEQRQVRVNTPPKPKEG